MSARIAVGNGIFDHVGDRLLGGDGMAARQQRASGREASRRDAAILREQRGAPDAFDRFGEVDAGIAGRGVPAVAKLASQAKVGGEPGEVDDVFEGALEKLAQLDVAAEAVRLARARCAAKRWGSESCAMSAR